MTTVTESPLRARPWNPLAAYGLVMSVFILASVAGRAVPHSVTVRFAWAAQAVQQGLMLIVALAALIASGRPLAAFGFRRAGRTDRHFAPWGLLLGAVSTVIMLAFALPGMRSRLAGYGFAGVVLWIWLVSSVVEEIFCRGWFQSLVAGPDGADPRAARAAVIWSAGLFGSMHLSLLFAGVDIASVALTVVSVTALGYVCALARARTGSLLPAIVTHVAFNAGGFVGGALYAIVFRVATGHMPSM
jgi:membrane protease YdiL (CAAX protease family)